MKRSPGAFLLIAFVTACSARAAVGVGAPTDGSVVTSADTVVAAPDTGGRVIDPPSQCLTGQSCIEDRDCPSGARCNSALGPPRCQMLFCGSESSRCSQDGFCAEGLRCWEGVCRRCNGCGAACIVDFQTDAMHCGRCGVSAPLGGTCVNGQGACPEGRTNCDGRCVDTSSDPRHCGGCGMAVPSGASCGGGATECRSGYTLCDGRCVDTNRDANHCGACGVRVTAPYSCVNGQQACATRGQVVCGGACVDTTTSRAHCGSCDRACPSGATCTGGRCIVSTTMMVRESCATICANRSGTCIEGRGSVVCGSGFLPGSLPISCATVPPSSCNSSGAGAQPFHSITCSCQL